MDLMGDLFEFERDVADRRRGQGRSNCHNEFVHHSDPEGEGGGQGSIGSSGVGSYTIAFSASAA